MLAANEAVAKKLLFSKQPAIYRVHDQPDPDRLVDLREVLESFGYELKGDLEEVPPSAFQRILEQIEGKPEERLLSDLLLRAQRKAIYSEECRGHYALAAPYYCHFTSPIRRYPDLIVHRQLTRLLERGAARAGEGLRVRQREPAPVAKLSSERERRAEQAERESLLWKKIVFMKDKVGREFDAFVTGVTSFGALRDAQGLLRRGARSRCRRWARTSSCTRRNSTACGAARAGSPTGWETACASGSPRSTRRDAASISASPGRPRRRPRASRRPRKVSR